MNQFGVKQQGMVFADGGILAKQWKNGSFEKVRWEHTNPATGVIWRTDDSGTLLGREELDPLGAEMGKVNPYTSGSGGGGTGGDCEGVHVHTQQPAANDVDGSCYLNGVAAPCGTVMNMLNHGGATQIDLSKTDDMGRPQVREPKTPDGVEIAGIWGKLKSLFKNPRAKELSDRLSADSSTEDPYEPDPQELKEALDKPIIVNSDIHVSESAHASSDRPTIPTDTLPTNLRERVLRIRDGCAEYTNNYLRALGSGYNSLTFGALYDRIKTIEISSEPYAKAGLNTGEGMSYPGLSTTNNNSRQVYIYPDERTANSNQEFRWNKIAETVFFELFHHANSGSTYTDQAMDNAALNLMSAKDKAATKDQAHRDKWRNGTIANRAFNANCFNRGK
jgi:hypothetical protein